LFSTVVNKLERIKISLQPSVLIISVLKSITIILLLWST
jgi:hypothetical protein